MVWMTNGKNALLQCLWSQTLHNCTSQAETVFHLTLYTSAVCRVCDGLVMLSCVLGKPHPAGSCARLGAGEGKWALRCCSGADLLLRWRKPPVTIVLELSVGFFSRQAVLCTFLLRCILCVPLPRDAPSEPGLPRSRTKGCSLVRLPLRETSLLPGSAVLQCFPLGSEVGRGTGWPLQSEADSPRQGAERARRQLEAGCSALYAGQDGCCSQGEAGAHGERPLGFCLHASEVGGSWTYVCEVCQPIAGLRE